MLEVNGALYGTTGYGGATCGSGSGFCGGGTVFEVSTSRAENVLYSFKGPPDGALPESALTDLNGALYGTTLDGGAYGEGTVFEVSTSGQEQTVHSFKGNSGANPVAGLFALNGTLYGTTASGGRYRCDGGGDRVPSSR
jgi:uncharacterized repeat protein (TIGR03803 family)